MTRRGERLTPHPKQKSGMRPQDRAFFILTPRTVHTRSTRKKLIDTSGLSRPLVGVVGAWASCAHLSFIFLSLDLRRFPHSHI